MQTKCQAEKNATKMDYLNIKDENKNVEMSENTQNGPVSKIRSPCTTIKYNNNYGL